MNKLNKNISEKSINQWTKREFLALRDREWNEDIGEFDSLVILPTNNIHGSGFACMDFVAVNEGKPICKLSGCSDLLHMGGIGGFGEWLGRELPEFIEPIPWSIDCLKRSKLLRLFAGRKFKLKVGSALSSFEIYAIKK